MKEFDIDIRVSCETDTLDEAWYKVNMVANLLPGITLKGSNHQVIVRRVGEPTEVIDGSRCVTCGGSNGQCIIPCHG